MVIDVIRHGAAVVYIGVMSCVGCGRERQNNFCTGGLFVSDGLLSLIVFWVQQSALFS